MAKCGAGDPDNLLMITKDNKKICWRRFNDEDRDEVKKLLIESGKREQLAKALNPPEVHYEDFASYKIQKTLKHPYSVCAYELESKEICAIILCSGPYNAGSSALYTGETHCLESKQFYAICNKLLSQLPQHIKSDYYAAENINTKKEYDNTGIMQKLMRVSPFLSGFDYISLASSHISAKLSEAIGARCVAEVTYADYVDPYTGKKVFSNIRPPHKALKLFVMHKYGRGGKSKL